MFILAPSTSSPVVPFLVLFFFVISFKSVVLPSFLSSSEISNFSCLVLPISFAASAAYKICLNAICISLVKFSKGISVPALLLSCKIWKSIDWASWLTSSTSNFIWVPLAGIV